MNKVIQANLGGIAFTFDDEAYERLDDYLASLDGYFNHSHGHNEIMHDIEARLAELFSANLKGRSIVTTEDVSAAVATMGSPEDFGIEADDLEEEIFEQRSFGHQSRNRKGGKQRYSRYGKRLMRDPDDTKLGGVCSGLAAYFGIEDPLVIRIAFVVAVVFGGFGVLPYIILWAVMPVAHTAGDKLAMRGEAIDVRTISKQVEEEFSNISSKLQEWGDEVSKTDWSSKFGGGGKRRNQKRNNQEPHDEGYMV
jgi:phage shock protein PspC (stress-responsive transcriptional regulator)